MRKYATTIPFALLGLLLLLPTLSTAGMVGYRYDALHRLILVAYPDGTIVEYGYDPAGNRTRLLV